MNICATVKISRAYKYITKTKKSLTHGIKNLWIMRSLPRIFLCTTACLFLTYFVVYMPISREGRIRTSSNRNGSLLAVIVGWEQNISRETSQYILGNNLTAHILPEHFCDSQSFLLMMVCSAPHNFDARSAIRETWGSQKNVLGYNVSVYFLLGETANSTVENEVKLEANKYGDIIQERFADSYNNLTIKSVVMLKLVSNYCAISTKFILKIDDDMYVNLNLIIDMLHNKNASTDVLLGKLICNARPIKDKRSKWYSPHYMYQGKIYPNYLSGTGYVMSIDVAEKLYKTALETPIFHLEDVFITGICSKKSHIYPHNNPRFTYHQLNFDACLLKHLFTAHRFSPADIRSTYSILNDPNVSKICSQQKQKFSVSNWIVNNLLKGNKTYKKSKCE